MKEVKTNKTTFLQKTGYKQKRSLFSLGYHFFFMQRGHCNRLGVFNPFAVIGKPAMPAQF